MEEEEWEVCNDGGFIYKRQRRHLPPPSCPVLHHLSEVETHGRHRRSVALSKIRDMYKQEVALWEHLSDACLSMTENAEREKKICSLSDVSSSRGEEVLVSGRPETSDLVDKFLFQGLRSKFEQTYILSKSNGSAETDTELRDMMRQLVSILQAERQEAVIRDLTQMCDYVEALCDAQEEQIMDSLLQLPIWASPQELMAAMCDE